MRVSGIFKNDFYNCRFQWKYWMICPGTFKIKVKLVCHLTSFDKSFVFWWFQTTTPSSGQNIFVFFCANQWSQSFFCVLWWICVCLHTTLTGEIIQFLPRKCVFHNKPSSSHRHSCRGFHLRRTQISNLPSRSLCYNTCNIINKDLWAMRRTNHIVIANSSGIKHLYLSWMGTNLQVCNFKMLKLRLDRNLTFFT